MFHWFGRARERFRTRKGPVPPEDVQVVYADGRRVAMECLYHGRVKGIHTWIGVTPVPFQKDMTLQVGRLPARTLVRVQFTQPTPDDGEDDWRFVS